MKKEKVAFVVVRYGKNINGGAEYHCQMLAERLVSDYDVEVLTTCVRDVATAGNNNDGDAKDGRSGGFVGFNDEGLLKNNNMYYCDVVRGTKDLVGPFSGKSELDTVYDFNSQEKVEGEKNNYRIYRKLDQSLDQIEKNNSILNSSHEKDDASGWDIYTIGHMNPVKTFETLKNAVLASKGDSVKADLNAYESPAKAVLMSDTKTERCLRMK